MDLAKRDILIKYLQNMKKEKEEFLNDKRINLSNHKADNPYLIIVADAYNDDFDRIMQEKTNQQTALQVLADYMTQIILEPTATAEMKKQAKYDQKMILGELKNCKKTQ